MKKLLAFFSSQYKPGGIFNVICIDILARWEKDPFKIMSLPLDRTMQLCNTFLQRL